MFDLALLGHVRGYKQTIPNGCPWLALAESLAESQNVTGHNFQRLHVHCFVVDLLHSHGHNHIAD